VRRATRRKPPLRLATTVRTGKTARRNCTLRRRGDHGKGILVRLLRGVWSMFGSGGMVWWFWASLERVQDVPARRPGRVQDAVLACEDAQLVARDVVPFDAVPGAEPSKTGWRTETMMAAEPWYLPRVRGWNPAERGTGPKP